MAFLLKNLLQYRNGIAFNAIDDDSNYEKAFSRQDSLRPEFFRQLLDEAIYKNYRRDEDDSSTSNMKPTADNQKLAKFEYLLKDKNVFNGNPDNIQYLGVNGQKYLDLNSTNFYSYGNIKKQIKANDTIAAVVACVGVVIAFIVNDVYIDNNRESDSIVTIFNYIVTISTLALVCLIYRHYSLHHEANKTDSINPKAHFWQTKQLRWFILELLINLVHVPPHADVKFAVSVVGKPVTYTLVDFISVFMTLRIYLVLRLFAQYTEWMQSTAIYACQINECEADTIFALKAAFKKSPYIFLTSSMVIMTLILGLCVRTFERPYYLEYVEEEGDLFRPTRYQDYESVWNVFWLVFVTMSTVGFGDYYPITHFGRALVAIAALFGIFNTSLVVYTLAISSALDDSETKAYEVIRRMKHKNNVMNKAADVITKFIRIGILKKKLALNKDESIENRIKETNREMQAALMKLKVAQEARKQTFRSVHQQLKEIVEDMKVDIKTIKGDLIILEEISEKMNSIEDYNLKVMRKLNQEYSTLLYTEKMLDLLSTKENEKNFPVIESLKSQTTLVNTEDEGTEQKAFSKKELTKNWTLNQLEKEDDSNFYHETNLIRNIRKVELKVKVNAEQQSFEQNFVQFEPSTPTY